MRVDGEESVFTFWPVALTYGQIEEHYRAGVEAWDMARCRATVTERIRCQKDVSHVHSEEKAEREHVAVVYCTDAFGSTADEGRPKRRTTFRWTEFDKSRDNPVDD